MPRLSRALRLNPPLLAVSRGAIAQSTTSTESEPMSLPRHGTHPSGGRYLQALAGESFKATAVGAARTLDAIPCRPDASSRNLRIQLRK